MAIERTGLYRFGVFEADVATGELRQRGLRIRLAEQPLQVLLLLLEQPGTLVTREEICRRLWPGDTFVDFDHGVNSAVNRIREALGDRASEPRFIETLARRGYRFIAPVEFVPTAAPQLPEPSVSTQAEVQVQPAISVSPGDSPGPHSFLHRYLAREADLPHASRNVVQACFAALQCMYLAFYIGALANLREITDLLGALPFSAQIFFAILMTAALLIPLRLFLLCAALFAAPNFRAKFFWLWPFVLVSDMAWSLSPLLLQHHISFGLALACTAVLLYSPFAQRSLVLMGAGASVSPRSSVAAQTASAAPPRP